MLWGLAVVVVVWLASGVRQLDSSSEFGVIDGVVPGLPLRTDRGVAIVPPGVTHLTRYPKSAVEIDLPRAAEASIPGPDGSRYGLLGSAVLEIRPERWREAHEASGGHGLRGVLLSALAHSAPPVASRWERRGSVAPTDARAFRERLAAELDRRGVELRELALDGVEPLIVEASDPSTGPVPETRLLVVGLDGADWEIIDPLIEQGRLPNLAALIQDGVRAKLLTINPMLSPVVWTTVATGVEPSRHGILDFIVPDPAGGTSGPVTSAQRRVATVWQMLSRAAVRVGVVGWWASWPAEPVNGYLVSDRVAYQLFGYRSDADVAEGKVWPPEIYPRVRSAIVPPDSVPFEDVVPFLSGERTRLEQFDDEEREMLDEFRTLLASGRTYLRVAAELAREDPPELEVVYFEGTDTVGHLFMRFRAPQLPGVSSPSFESFQDVVDRYYETADAYLGELLRDRGEAWTVVVLSDHGFVTDSNRPRTSDPRIGHGPAADWHRRFGVLILSGRHVRRGVELAEATVYDIAPTILALFGRPVPRSWPGVALAAALEPSFIERHPVKYRLDDPPLSEWRAEAVGAQVDPAARDVLEKLESLGYLGSASEGEATPTLSNRNNAGVALMSEGRYDDAEAEFRAALEAHPDHPSVVVNLALVLKLQGRNDEAGELLRGAMEIPMARRAAGLQLGEMAYEAGEIDAAEGYLREVLRFEPDAAEVRATLGLVLEARGDMAAAEAEYRRAAELDPGAALSRNNLGNLAKRDGDTAGAERWYRSAIDADPYFMGAYNNLALLFQERGEVERAIELYQDARRRSPGNAIVLNNLASLHYATGNHAEARALWRQAVRFDPAYPSPLNNLAGLAIAEGRYDEAEKLLALALARNDAYGDARINLALVHRALGRRDEARHELSLAADDPAAHATAVTELAVMDLEDGDAVAAVERLSGLDGRARLNRRVLNLSGEAYRRVGRTAEAAEAWRRSLSLDPSQEEIVRALAELTAGEPAPAPTP